MALADTIRRIFSRNSLLRPLRSLRPNVRNSYEAAGTGRRLVNWRPGMVGPNASTIRELAQLRDRSRESIRNNGWMVQGQNNWVSNVVGCGIYPEPASSNTEFNTAAKSLWDEWTAVADADHVWDFYGLIALSERERRESGEIFIRLRPRRLNEGLPAPFQLQLLESEICPETYTDTAKNIRAGIQFNGIGARTAYWMYREHPGDFFSSRFNGGELVAVPASSVIHYGAPLRAGQLRYPPMTVQALIKAKDFDEYDDAELVRKKNKAAYTGAITRKEPLTEEEAAGNFDPLTGQPIVKDTNGIGVTQVEAGSFFTTFPGEDVKLFEGDQTGSGYAEFCRQQLLAFSASLGIPYEFLSGDMSKVNDRLMRVILNEYHRLIEQTQWHLTVPQLCLPVWRLFVDSAVAAGNLDAPGYAENRNDYLKVTWNTHRWPYINPIQDVEAAGKEIMYGLQSRTGAAAERGFNAEEIDKQNAEDKKRAESLGLTYETHAPANNKTPVDPNAPDDGDTNSPGYSSNKVTVIVSNPKPEPQRDAKADFRAAREKRERDIQLRLMEVNPNLYE